MNSHKERLAALIAAGAKAYPDHVASTPAGAVVEVTDNIIGHIYDRDNRTFVRDALNARDTLALAEKVILAAAEYRKVERDLLIGSAGLLDAKQAAEALDEALRQWDGE